MKEARAHLKYLNIAPRKTRRVADLVRGLPVVEAEAQLRVSPRRPSDHILKALRSAVANAKNNQLDTAKLYIKEIRVDQGPRLKRWTPRARGAVSMIEKKMSHVTIVLGEAEKPFATRFVLPEKPKKKEVKEEKKKDVEEDREKKMRTEERPIAPVRPAAKSGLFQKVFRRKSI